MSFEELPYFITPKRLATTRERKRKGSSPFVVAECAPREEPTRPAHVKLPAGHAQSHGAIHSRSGGRGREYRFPLRAERRQVGYGRPQREAGGGGVWLNLRHYRSTANGLLIIVEERR